MVQRVLRCRDGKVTPIGVGGWGIGSKPLLCLLLLLGYFKIMQGKVPYMVVSVCKLLLLFDVSLLSYVHISGALVMVTVAAHECMLSLIRKSQFTLIKHCF